MSGGSCEWVDRWSEEVLRGGDGSGSGGVKRYIEVVVVWIYGWWRLGCDTSGGGG